MHTHLCSTKCRFKTSTPSSILKGAPDFCSVYVISKGRISSVRSAARRAPHASPLQRQIESLNDENGSENDTPCRRLSFKSLFLQTNLVLVITFRLNLSDEITYFDTCFNFRQQEIIQSHRLAK